MKSKDWYFFSTGFVENRPAVLQLDASLIDSLAGDLFVALLMTLNTESCPGEASTSHCRKVAAGLRRQGSGELEECAQHAVVLQRKLDSSKGYAVLGLAAVCCNVRMLKSYSEQVRSQKACLDQQYCCGSQ